MSGTTYEAWVDRPSETVSVKAAALIDRATAILTLDDGREVEVLLVGSTEEAATQSDTGTPLRPRLLLIADHPELASLSPEEISGRLRLIATDGLWCSHWSDEDLEAQAAAQARSQAIENLDWIEYDYDFPADVTDSQRRETLLHLLAKDLLALHGRMKLPELVASVAGHKELVAPSVTAQFSDVTLERKLGALRPDVMATIGNQHVVGIDRLLIEVTVSNPLALERIGKITATEIPSLEIDLSLLGGALTKKEFESLLIDDVACKRWIFHPHLAAAEERLKAKLREEEDREPNKIAARFLQAMADYGQAACSPVAPPDVSSKRALVMKCAGQLVDLGYKEASTELLLRPGHLINRLQSIKDNKPVGYRVDTAWQVINAILQEHDPYRRWQTLYLMAIAVWKPTLTEAQRERVGRWREEVINSLRAGEDVFRRPPDYDKLLALLFPELAPLLARPLPRKGHKGIDAAGAHPATLRPSNSGNDVTGEAKACPAPASSSSENIENAVLLRAGMAAGSGITPRAFAASYARERNVSSERVLRILLDFGVARSDRWWS